MLITFKITKERIYVYHVLILGFGCAFFGLDDSKELCSNSLYFTLDQRMYCEETQDMN